MYNEQVVSQINFEIQQIDKLLMTYKNVLEKSKGTEPDMVEMTAIASVIHSFYNGLENIFSLISKRIDLHTNNLISSNSGCFSASIALRKVSIASLIRGEISSIV